MISTYRASARAFLAFACLLSAPALAAEMRIDFGRWSQPITADWNNARGLVRTGSVGLKNTAGSSTGYTLVMTKGFTEVHGLGAKSAYLGLPLSSCNDSVYGNTIKGTVGGQTTYWSPTATMELRGLNPAYAYSFSFYAFVFQNDTVNRSTQYVVRGANTTALTGSLNPTNNTSAYVSIANVRPSSTGKIIIDVSKGAGNNSSAGFYHLSSMKVTYGPAVATAAVSAGKDQAITLPTNAVTLTATATSGTFASYAWTKTSGGAATIASPGAASTKVSGLVAGTYVFKVTAKTSSGASTSDSVSVTVNAASTYSCRPASDTPDTTGVIKSCAVGTSGAPYGYVEYLPPNYGSRSDWPLIIFLHGIGEKGTGTATDVLRIQNFGPFSWIHSLHHEIPFVVLGPQELKTDPDLWNVDKLEQFVQFAIKTYHVDPSRIHLTGLSLGGGGTVAYAQKYASRLATMAPVSTGYYSANLNAAQTIVNNHVAIWATHSKTDTVAPFASRIQPFMEQIGTVLGETESPMATYPKVTGTESGWYDPALRHWAWRPALDYRKSNGVAPDYPLTFTIYSQYAASTGGGHNAWNLYVTQLYYDWLALHRRN